MSLSTENSRLTFAIISHPDAGKTTITEKLLFHGRVIRKSGMVKSKSGDFAKSDWMEMEKERGISITSSVMSFPYSGRTMHLLDTPGHKDFSEDTYRTLTAVESVLMMIDSAKGVEEQTIKLMEVCRLRDTPIVTFMNKLDRDSLSPFELIENLESILSIQCVPMTWPIGSGVDFKGVYDFRSKSILLYKKGEGHSETILAEDLNDSIIKDRLGNEEIEKLKEDIEMVMELIPSFSMEEFLAGIQTPVFFGTALYDFGVNDVLDFLALNAPGPSSREVKLYPFDENAPKRMINPDEKKFTGFIFKIQANMDKKHRDRVAFLRVCSGSFERNQKIFHVREEKEVKIATPLIFQAQDREIAEKAEAGDIIGLYDSNKYQIGDSFSEGEKIQFTGIPSFAPEIFKTVLLKDPLKAKQLEKGLLQLSEEGQVQLFIHIRNKTKILGAVGGLQFEVVKERLLHEYNVHGEYEPFTLAAMRWPLFPNEKSKQTFIDQNTSVLFKDRKDRLCIGVRSEWDLKLIQEKNPDVIFFKNSDYQ